MNGLEAPFLLLGAVSAALAAAVLLVVLRESKFPRVRIPALHLAEPNPPRLDGGRSLPPNWWLWVLALAAAAAGAAHLSVPEELPRPTRTVVVVDVGVESMARDGRSDRLGSARDSVLASTKGGGPGDEFALVAAGSTPEVVCPWKRSRSELERALADLRAGADRTNWAAAFDLAATMAGEDGRLLVVGGRAQTEFEKWRADTRRESPAATVGSDFASSVNRGIEFLARTGSSNGPDAIELQATVRAVGDDVDRDWFEEQTKLAVTSGGRPVPNQQDASTPVPSFDSASRAQCGWFRIVRIAVSGRFDDLTVALATGDALAVDDEATVVFPPPPRVRVADGRAGRSDEVVRRIVAALPGADVKLAAGQPAEADLWVRAGIRAVPSEARGDVLEYADEDACVPMRFVDHDVASPLTGYVNALSPIDLRATPLPDPLPPGLRAVAWADSPNASFGGTLPTTSPIVAAGENGGRRRVLMGFDIGGEDLMEQRPLAVVVVHSLEWLATSHPGAVLAGHAYPLGGAADGPRVLVLPGGDEISVAASAGEIDGRLLRTPGVHAVTDADGARRRFAVNPCVGDLRTPSKRVEAYSPTRAVPIQAAQRARPVAWPWLAVALLLAADIVVALWPRDDGSRAPLATGDGGES